MSESLIHRQSVARIRERFNAKSGGFKKAIKASIAFRARADRCFMQDEYCDDAISGISFVPDAWKIHHRVGPWITVTCFEIEASSELTDYKLMKYVRAWFDCDCDNISLHLIVTDRYGQNLREIDLMERWYAIQLQK